MADFESDLDLFLFLTSEGVQAALQDMPAYEHPFWLAQGADLHAVVEDDMRKDFSCTARPPTPKAFPPFTGPSLAAGDLDSRTHHIYDSVPSADCGVTSYSSSPDGRSNAPRHLISNDYQELSSPQQLWMPAGHHSMSPSTLHQPQIDFGYGSQPPQSLVGLVPQTVVGDCIRTTYTAPSVGQKRYNDGTYPEASEVSFASNSCLSPSAEFDSQLDPFPQYTNPGLSNNHVHVAALSPYSTAPSYPSSEGGNDRRPPIQNHISYQSTQQSLAPQYNDNSAMNPFNDFQSASGCFEQCTQVRHAEFSSEELNRRRIAKQSTRQPRNHGYQPAHGIGPSQSQGHSVRIGPPASSTDMASGYQAFSPVDNRTRAHGGPVTTSQQVVTQRPVWDHCPPATTHAVHPSMHRHSSASLEREVEQPQNSKSVRRPETGGSTSSEGDFIERNQPNKIHGSGRQHRESSQAAAGHVVAAQAGPEPNAPTGSTRSTQFKFREHKSRKRTHDAQEESTDGLSHSASQKPNKRPRTDSASSSLSSSSSQVEIPSPSTSSSSSSKSGRPAKTSAQKPKPGKSKIVQERYGGGMVYAIDKRALQSEWLERPFIPESGIPAKKGPTLAESKEVDKEERLEG
ncbi:hypothetical protein CVT26_013412 [Gymnopilus dilepis]|uniref:Uncharacterized protein n=1 Tax=Gymnopilus dilepis TaxID=231916 RepID=A0A409VUZ8_9AGAR|nr:hypothetical protein CVT26_013412 [Gymnopilus dilepis]